MAKRAAYLAKATRISVNETVPPIRSIYTPMQGFLSRPALRCLFFSCALLAAVREPALSMTTQQEISWGRDISREVVAEQGVLYDPLLTKWVNDVGAKLTQHTVRADVPYTFRVINSEEVNAFSIPGGFVFVDAGLLNFVHSDDELAGILGHEIGHVERRHVVTINQKAKALEIILDIAGIFVPGVSRFGSLAGDLILLKVSRVEEIQADQYGLMLMSHAGYDPAGMPAFLQRLESINPEHKSLLGRYFETHPALGDRVKHLLGYSQLDRPTSEALLTQAIHDYGEGSYYTARQKLDRVLATQPHNALALDYQARIAPLFSAVSDAPQHPSSAILARCDAAVSAAQTDALAAKARRKIAKRELDDYDKYLAHVGYYVDPQTRIGIGRGSRLDRILSGQVQIGQYLDHSYDQISQTVAQAQDVADADLKIAKELRARLDHPNATAPIDADQYGLLLTRVEIAHGELVRAVDAARGAMAVGWQQGKIVSKFLDDFDAVSNYKGGDMQPADYRSLRMPLLAALAASQRAAKAGDLATGLLNDAQSLETLDQIALTAPVATAARRSGYARVIGQRFGTGTADVEAALTQLRDPGDVAAAAAISAETGKSLAAVVAEYQRSGKSVVDYSEALGVRPETLQLELGLVWLSYSDGKA